MDDKFKVIKAIFSGINTLRLVIINIVFFYILILVFAVISSVAKTSDKNILIGADSVLLFQPSGVIVENAGDRSLTQQLLSQGKKVLSASNIVDTIISASYDRRINALVFDFSAIHMSLSSAYEIKAALDTFAASGKPYYAFNTSYNLPSYFVASSAERICIDPLGEADFSGLASQSLFFGGMHEKTGFQYFVSKAGTYKGAADRFTEKAFTKEVRENYESMFTEEWNYFVKTCAENRKISEKAILEYTESPLAILQKTNGNSARALHDLNLVTDVATFSEFLKTLSFHENTLVAYEDFAMTLKPVYSRNTVCIINLEGAITSNSSASLLQDDVAEDSKIVAKFEQAYSDPQVRAIVLRVNSGGGEVFASEVIRRELELARTKYNIPVVVSMSGVAASGAYWISSSADYIFANPFTITGSIGVLASLPNVKDALQKYLGVSTDIVYKGSKPLSILEKPTVNDMQILQLQISSVYDTFLQTVSSGRKMTKDEVATIASGKVYSGNQALQIGLVDKLGTLQDAVRYAAALGGVESDYMVKTITDKKTFWQEILLTASETGVTFSQVPILHSLIEISVLARKNKFIVYEPITFCEY